MDKYVNLLYVQNDDDVGHFALIKNLSRLVSSVNIDTRNSFATGMYMFNKKIIKYFITLREKKKLYFFLQMPIQL